MITFKPTVDDTQIKDILFDPSILPWICEFHSELDKDTFKVDHAYLYLLAEDEDEVCGLAKMRPLSSACWELHSAILPAYRGNPSHYFNSLAVDLLEHTAAEKVITWIPEDNKRAKLAAEAAGFKQEGFIPKAWRKGEDIIGLYLFGVEL